MPELPPTRELFERYGAMVHRRCAAILRSDEAARDAVQEVFLRVIERRGQFRGDAAPATWLYAIATLHCLQQLRDQAGRSTKLAELAEQPPDKPARIPEERHEVAKLLDGESDDLRLMIYLYYVDGMTLDEVARAVGRSRKTVARHVHGFLANARASLVGETERKHRRARKIVIAAVAVAIAIFALLPRRTAVAEAEVLTVERAWTNALVDNDVAALDAILADDYRSTDASGRVRTKADDLSRAKSKTLRFDVYDTTNLRVRVWGNTAVVTGQSALRGSHGGTPFAANITFTDTLARIDGRWRAVSAHVTRLD